MQHIKNNKVEVCFLQETFLTKHDGAVLQEIREHGYRIHSVPRTDGGDHGGLAVVYLPQINLKCQTNFQESVCLKTTSNPIQSKLLYAPLVNIL